MSQMQTPFHTFVPTWTLGDRLLRARKSRGLSQAELAEAIGIHQRSISNYEADVTVPNWAIIRAWASECQINLSWLATGDPYADPPGPGTWAAGRRRGTRAVTIGYPIEGWSHRNTDSALVSAA